MQGSKELYLLKSWTIKVYNQISLNLEQIFNLRLEMEIQKDWLIRLQKKWSRVLCMSCLIIWSNFNQYLTQILCALKRESFWRIVRSGVSRILLRNSWTDFLIWKEALRQERIWSRGSMSSLKSTLNTKKLGELRFMKETPEWVQWNKANLVRSTSLLFQRSHRLNESKCCE